MQTSYIGTKNFDLTYNKLLSNIMVDQNNKILGQKKPKKDDLSEPVKNTTAKSKNTKKQESIDEQILNKQFQKDLSDKNESNYNSGFSGAVEGKKPNKKKALNN